jgi:rhodanese-related sulfurtransferase
MFSAVQPTQTLPHGSLHALPINTAAAPSALTAARQKADRLQLSYAGDVTPQEAWELFSCGVAKLVDVRTATELRNVGSVADAHHQDVQHVEWLKDGDMTCNPFFLRQLEAVVSKGNVVLFLCRSGKRSVAAAEAASAAGFRNAFNILEGFEGTGNPKQGWLNHGLPVIQD